MRPKLTQQLAKMGQKQKLTRSPMALNPTDFNWTEQPH